MLSLKSSKPVAHPAETTSGAGGGGDGTSVLL